MQNFSLVYMFFPFFSSNHIVWKINPKNVTEGYTIVSAKKIFNEVIDGKSSDV